MTTVSQAVPVGQPEAKSSKPPTPSQASFSCSECLRRKQKCDKQWPCKNCQDRRVPHLCNFKRRRTRTSTLLKDAQQAVEFSNLNPVFGFHCKRKISYIEEPDDEAIVYASRQYHLQKDLEELGMMGHGRNSRLRQVLGEAFNLANSVSAKVNRESNQQLDVFPPKPYTDILIYNFFDNINFVYCICHRESLLQEYDKWWQTRQTHPDNVLEGLLFRLMAISAQFLPLSTCERLESVMSSDIIKLKHKWHQLAEARHRGIRPGRGGLKHVQQLFLSASFYKTEALFVDSWHALSAAIHAAQELDMHRDSKSCSISEFELELRRQVWCSLYTWDRLTAFFFDRPPKIHRGRTELVEPDPDLHRDSRHPDLPSPVLSRILELRLARIVDKYLDRDLEHADAKLLAMAQKDIKDWLQSLPSVFCIRDANTSWDSEHPHITYSRLGLHITAYSALFSVSKACLANIEFPSGSSRAERERLRISCIEYCVRLTDVVDRLTRYAPHARFFMAFCLFETSATVCAAMIKDTQHRLPQRKTVLRALGRSKDVLNRLSHNTVVAQGSAKILNQLLECLKSQQPDTSNDLSEGQVSELDIDHGVFVDDVNISLHNTTIGYGGSDSDVGADGNRGTNANETHEQLARTDRSTASPEEFADSEKLSAEVFKCIDLLSNTETWEWHGLGLVPSWSDSTDFTGTATDKLGGN